MAKQIFVIGHKSPDTDSICSALALAKLQQAKGIDAVAVRAGDINKETAYALSYFHIDLQPLVTDFYVKVGEVVRTEIESLPVNASLKDAAKWFDQYGGDVAPVTENGVFIGVLEKNCLAEEFIKTVLGQELSTVKQLAKEGIPVFSLTDKGHDVPAEGRYPVVNSGKYVGMVCAECVASAEKRKVILVDHNEKKQIVDGIEEAEIISVVDHHRIGGTLDTESPIFILFKPVGCTATIITELYAQEGIEIPKDIAGLLLSAIVSDTVLFRSPTCTDQDKAAAEKLSAIAGVDMEKYGMEMLKAGANVSDLSPEEIAQSDMKEFSGGGKTFTISQVQVMDTSDLLAQKTVLLGALEKFRAAHAYDASFLMITSIIDESTNFIFAGNMEDVVDKAFGKDILDKEVYLPGVMSRKKQIVPPILAALK